MNLKVEYIGEIEVIFKMALGNKSGDQVGSIHENNQRSKISWDYPFKQHQQLHQGLLDFPGWLNFSVN